MVFTMRSVNFILLILIFLFGCKQPEKNDNTPDYEVYVDEILNLFAQEIESEFGFISNGNGGRMPYDVEEILIDFIAYQNATIEEARKLEVDLTERFLKTINSYEPIRPYLREYPFNPNRATVTISFTKPDGTPYTDGNVTFVFQVKNKIFYRTRESETLKLIPLKEEPYEEAIKIVRGN